MMNPPTSRSLTASLAFMAVCSIAVMAFASIGFLRTERQAEQLMEQDQALALASSQMLAQELQMGQALRGIVLDPGDQAARRSLEAAAEEFSLLIDKALRQSATDPAAAASLREIEQLRDKQRPIHADIVAAAKQRPADAVAIIERDEAQVWNEIRQRLQRFGAAKKTDIQASMDTVRQIGHTAMLTAAALGSLALLGALALFLYFSHLTRRITATMSVVDKLKGDGVPTASVAGTCTKT